MTSTLRDSLPMLVGLALLTAIGYLLVSATGRSWFEHDVQMRADLAVRGAQRGLVSRWSRGDRKGVEQLLEDITRDERIVGAAACSRSGGAFARTAEFPRDVSCDRFTAQALAGSEPRPWNEVARIGDTRAYLSAFPLSTEEGPIGVIALIHDMSYIEHRDAVTRRAALSLFLLLGLAAVLGSTATARASLRRFRDELHG